MQSLMNLVAVFVSAALVVPCLICIVEIAGCAYPVAETAGKVELDSEASQGMETEETSFVITQDTL